MGQKCLVVAALQDSGHVAIPPLAIIKGSCAEAQQMHVTQARKTFTFVCRETDNGVPYCRQFDKRTSMQVRCSELRIARGVPRLNPLPQRMQGAP
jgi:hypothetical protein